MGRDDCLRKQGSIRTVGAVGILLGGFISVALFGMVLHDRGIRVAAAGRQSLALATGVDRLLKYELGNIERMLQGVVVDGDRLLTADSTAAAALPSGLISGLRARQPDLFALERLDVAGSLDGPVVSRPALTAWLSSVANQSSMVFGPPSKDEAGAWSLPLAVRTASGAWVSARLRTAEFTRMIAGLDTGSNGIVSVLDGNGIVLARGRDAGAYVGRQLPIPQLKDGLWSESLVSQLDHVTRVASFSANSGYPIVVSAGLGLDEALAPWRTSATVSAALIALYWLGLAFLVRRLVVADVAREAADSALRDSTDWLRQAQEASHTGVWRIEADDNYVRASPHAADLFGFPPGLELIPIEQFFERMSPDDAVRVEQEFTRARAHGTPFKAEYRIRLPDGRSRWIVACGSAVVDVHGHPRMTGTIVDVTERHEALAAITRVESQFRELFELNPMPFWVFDRETLRFLAVNQAAIRTYGYSHAQFLQMTITDIRPPEHVPAFLAFIHELPQEAEGVGTWVHRTRDGRLIDVRARGSSISFAGRAARLVLAEDVSERVAYERDLAWRATHDSTTGLMSGEALVAQLDSLPATAPAYAVAYVRLRDLELVAPTLGRRASVAILCAAAERFGEVGRRYGACAYTAAESFAIVALDASSRDAMLAALIEATATPVEVEGGVHPLEASIGLAESGCEDGRGEQVIGNAALAALQARNDGLPVVKFDAVMATQAAARLTLASKVRRAFERNEFELFFQPILRLQDNSIVSLEALLRWRRPDGTFVSPADFIPLCEESGLIVPIGAWVLEQAARSHVLLAAEGLGDVAIAVNVSAVQFVSDSFAQSLRDLRTTHRLPRDALHIELTESVVLRRPEAARDAMKELREEGVRISIDDFGTGFSSMAYLKNLPLDHLKIDRSFIADVHRDERSAEICRALIALGHGLGLEIIAEGVESAAQLDWLRRHGCDQVQGYHFGYPTPLRDVIALIQHRRTCRPGLLRREPPQGRHFGSGHVRRA